jgi:preprotein translocase subunit YajC
MNDEVLNILLIFIGLVSFTFMIYISRRQKKKIGDRKDRIKNKWRDRIE